MGARVSSVDKGLQVELEGWPTTGLGVIPGDS